MAKVESPEGARRASLSRRRRVTHRGIALALALPAGAHAARPPAGELLLDADAPIVAARVAGVAMRLRVDPGQWSTIELAPAAAARLPLAFEPGGDAEVGRATLPGRVAHAELVINGRKTKVQLSEHGRAPVADADGVIGPDLLPYATIRWHRAAAPTVSGRRVLPLALDEAIGLTAAGPIAPIRLRFTLLLAGDEATAAAGSALAAGYGGRFDGPRAQAPAAFGLSRPIRPLALDRPVEVAGFRVARLAVRIVDFRGHTPLPDDPPLPGEVRVVGRDRPQHGEYWVGLGRERLGRCADIVYSSLPRTLTLVCAFD